jgi:hypothetical protein
MRPWRVGLLIDVADPAAVRLAIHSLSRVWGGVYLPILDIGASLTDLQKAARIYNLDSLWAENPEGELREMLRVAGYFWRGGGPWAPFARGEGSFRRGLVSADVMGGVVDRGSGWDQTTASDLTYAAYFGIGDETPIEGIVTPSRVVDATRVHLRPSLSYVDPIPQGLFVVRPNQPTDAVWYWNARAFGGNAYAFASEDADFNRHPIYDLTTNGIPQPSQPQFENKPTVPSNQLQLWGATDLSDEQRERIRAWADHREIELVSLPREAVGEGAWFPGFDAPASRSFRHEIEPTASTFAIELPRLPVVDAAAHFQGVVAAEIEIHEDTKLDPRLSLAFPPHRRHAALLERALAFGADHVRVSGGGPVISVQVTDDSVTLPTASNLEVMRLLFDDESVRVDQSDEGKFQSRAAEMLGGPFSGALTQPALRAAIERTAAKTAGITFEELKGTVAKNRGAWPDKLQSHWMTPDRYVTSVVRPLLNSGLLVPMLDAQCTSCRVVSRVHPKDLDAEIVCDFCGERFNLALALALAKPTWRYRLAGQLGAERVRAMLPALAALSTLGQLNMVEGPRLSHVLGLEVAVENHPRVEVDVAAILHEDSWTVVLGEVKNANRIDENDAQNLGRLQAHLLAKDVVCIVMFATLKDEFGPDEKAAIRALVEARNWSATVRSTTWPVLPLLFTAGDLSVPWGDEQHPWRWPRAGSGSGILGTALESCKRHLGLIEATSSGPGPGTVNFTWIDT